MFKVGEGDTVTDIVTESLDLVTTAVPAALPLALTVGIVFAQNRLKTQGIFCINPNVINVSGSIDVFCFDKVSLFCVST